MVGKDNWRGFLDAIYSKWCLFLPILSPFLQSRSFCPPHPPPTFHLLAELPISPLLSFFLPFHLIFKCEIWINLLCVAEGTTSCELQILANTAIYLKWQIRESNLLEMRRFFELSSLWKKFVFSHCTGCSCRTNSYRNACAVLLWKKYNSEKQDGLWFRTLLRWTRCWEVLGISWRNWMLSVKFRFAFVSPYYFHMVEAVTYVRSTTNDALQHVAIKTFLHMAMLATWSLVHAVCQPCWLCRCVGVLSVCVWGSLYQSGRAGPSCWKGAIVGHPSSQALWGDPMSLVL